MAKNFFLSAEYRSGEEYLKALRERGYRISEHAEDVLMEVKAIPEEQVRIMRLAVQDLGFSGRALCSDILFTAKARGFHPCPLWVGPQYRMECDDDDYVSIGMEPIADSVGDVGLFGIRHYARVRWLRSHHANYHWRLHRDFLFVVR